MLTSTLQFTLQIVLLATIEARAWVKRLLKADNLSRNPNLEVVCEIFLLIANGYTAFPLFIMKCLSLKQPFADLLVSGKKTIELRKWNTKFRGKFLIHASKNLDKERAISLNIDYTKLSQGVISRAIRCQTI